MPSITFTDLRVLSLFHTMAEGMEEIAADTGEQPRAELLSNLITTIGCATDVAKGSWPLVVELTAELAEIARSVLDNCLASAGGIKPDDPEAEDYLFPGQVVIIPRIRLMPISEPEALIIVWALFVATNVKHPKHSAEDVVGILEKFRTAFFHTPI